MTTMMTTRKKTIRGKLVTLCLLLASIATDAFRQGLPLRARSIPLPVSESKAVSCMESRDVLVHEEEKSANAYMNSSKDNNNSICVLVEKDEQTGGFREEAQRIADLLEIPLLSTLDSNSDDDHEVESHHEFTHALKLVPYEYGDLVSTFALAIDPIDNGNGNSKKPKKKKKTRKNSASSAFFVDLCPPSNSKAGRRAAGNSGKADLLVKAVAPAKGSSRSLDHTSTQREGAVVWDLTAGLGQDALVLAHHGAQTVVMVERHPIVAALLQDAMRRLELVVSQLPDEDQEHHPSRKLWETLDFRVGDGRSVLSTSTGDSDCDVVYLDPMFPPRQKQSAVKKGMSILHGLLETHVQVASNNENNNGSSSQDGRQTEEQELLEAALAWAKLRVVVKRPAKAPLLGDGSTKPSHVLTGSVNRWDVYVKPQPQE